MLLFGKKNSCNINIDARTSADRERPRAKSNCSNTKHLICLRGQSLSISVLLVSRWRTRARRHTTVLWTSLLTLLRAQNERVKLKV